MSKSNFRQTDREVQAVFSENLRVLVGRVPSVSKLCRDLNINRTQFNKYLSGEATPRPLLLNRICQHFDTDARILLEPLSKLEIPAQSPFEGAVHDFMRGGVETVPYDVLPDRIYAEWMLSLVHPGMVSFNLTRMYTENGVRRYRIKIPNPFLRGPNFPEKSGKFSVFNGLIIRQGNEFSTMDHGEYSSILRFTTYRVGYSVNPGFYPGVKTTGTSYVPNMMNCSTPCFLEKLPVKLSKVLKLARTPRHQPFDKAPEYVREILTETSQSSFMVPGNPLWPTGKP